MKTLLLFGASGAVGRFLSPLLARDYRVVGVSRQAVAGSELLQADLTQDANWPNADIAVSAGPLDAFAFWLENYPQAPLKRIVAFSSMSTESKRESADEKERAIAQRLRDCETKILTIGASRDIAITIFRPTLIYGAGVDRSVAPIARFVRRRHWFPSFRGAIGLRQPVHAADLAAACAAVIEMPITFGKTYPLGGGEQLRLNDMIKRIRKHYSPIGIPVMLPVSLAKFGARRAGLGDVVDGAISRMTLDQIADNTAAEGDFGYAPRPFDVDAVLPRAP